MFTALAALLCVPLAKADDPLVLNGDWLHMLPSHFSPATMFEMGEEIFDVHTYYDKWTLLDENFSAVVQFDNRSKTLYRMYPQVTAGVDYRYYKGLYGICGKEYVYAKSIETTIANVNGYDQEASKGCIFITPNNDKEVGRITFPDGWYTTERIIEIIVPDEMSDKMYFVFSVHNVTYSNYCLLVYTTDGSSAGIKQVAMMPVSKVSPTAPRRGERVTVTLDEQMAAHGAEVRVVGSDGQVMMQSKTAAGQNTLDIPTQRLKQGVYVVTVGDKEATKIVIR